MKVETGSSSNARTSISAIAGMSDGVAWRTTGSVPRAVTAGW